VRWEGREEEGSPAEAPTTRPAHTQPCSEAFRPVISAQKASKELERCGNRQPQCTRTRRRGGHARRRRAPPPRHCHRRCRLSRRLPAGGDPPAPQRCETATAAGRVETTLPQAAAHGRRNRCRRGPAVQRMVQQAAAATARQLRALLAVAPRRGLLRQ
jgi:hypothetical protein